MNILIVHNAYQHQGGEDSVVEAEIEMLRQHGQNAMLYKRHNDEIIGMSRIVLMLDSLWSRRTYSELQALFAKKPLDVVHVHNISPLISPSLYWAAAQAGIPVVQTLHNFRLLCPQSMFLRNGKVCEDCLGRIPWRGAAWGCYRQSRVQSAVLAGTTVAHRFLNTWNDKVALYIALTEFCRKKFIIGGLPAKKIAVKPNFVDWVDYSSQHKGGKQRHGLLFVGRLSVEKGLAVLVRAMGLLENGITLRVAGSGPESNLLKELNNVTLLGALASQAVREEMRQSLALVMPSIWYENFPRTLVEAFASGLPVIVSRLGAMAEIVEDGVTGLHFTPGDAQDLATKVRWAFDHPEKMHQMGLNARRVYEQKYTPEENYRQLMAIYESVIREHRQKQS